jgi:hypothetical protein
MGYRARGFGNDQVDAVRELRAAERQRMKALVNADDRAARGLHAEDYQLITPGGATYSKDEYLGDIASGILDYLVFEPASDIAVQVFGDAGAVRYQARIDIRFASGGGDSGLFWHTDLYRRTDRRWQAVWSQATRIRNED